jgi:hypothetical protein
MFLVIRVRRALLLGACSTVPVAAGAQPITTRDSAGVHIIDHQSVRNAPIAFRFADKPLFEVGGLQADPHDEIVGQAEPHPDAIRLRDGRVAVAESWDVKFFDANGKYLATFGRQGQGPGEFPHQVGAFCQMRGDSILVLGYGDGRASLLDANGKFARFWAVIGDVPPHACFSDGTLITREPRGRRSPSDTNPVVMERFSLTPPGAPPNTPKPAFGRFPHATFSLAPRVTTMFVRDDLVYVADGDTYQISVYTKAGVVTRLIRSNDVGVPFTDADARGAFRFTSDRPLAAPIVYDRPARFPVFGRVTVDAAGRTWVEDAWNATWIQGRIRTTKPSWTVFGADGRLMGRVEIPVDPDASEQELIRVGADYAILAVSLKGDLGAIRYRIYGLTAR